MYDVTYKDSEGHTHNIQIGALSAVGAINSTLELYRDAKVVIKAKPADEF
jgi:hypothetical protein